MRHLRVQLIPATSVIAGLVLLVSWLPSPAQTTAGIARESTPASDAGTLGEVVVTAQRREENIQDVPVAAAVVSGLTLEQQNINSLSALTETTPGVHIESHPRSGDLYIRGIGSGENQSFDQSVGTFVDDIYHGRARTIAGIFLDLDRIEVLKGPQSTFFGNHAIAGAINIVTKKPGDTYEGYARALYGQYQQYGAEAAAGGPINDWLGLRVAATVNGFGGWIKNVNTGKEEPRQNNTAARATVVAKPGNDLDITLKLEGNVDRQMSTTYYQLSGCPPAAPFPSVGFCSAALAERLPTGLDTEENAKKPGDGARLAENEYVLTANYHRWDQTFTSVTGYYNYHFHLDIDGDLTPNPLLTAEAPERYDQFSQEFRITSPASQTIEYLAGAYLQTDSLHFEQGFSYFFLSPTISGAPALAPLRPYLPLGQVTLFDQREHRYAVFGSATWNISDRWKLTGGLRGSRVDKSYTWDAFFGKSTQVFGGITSLPAPLQPLAGAVGIGKAGLLAGSRRDKVTLPSARLQYKIDPEVMAYFSYSKGSKAGGFNGADNSGVASDLPYQPEHVNAFEVGLKSEWFDDRFLLNLAAFRANYTDLQVAVNIATNGGVRSLVQNAGSSESEGVELQVEWVATKELRLSLGIAYDDAHYVSYPNVTATQLQQLEGFASQDLSGRPTAFAPLWSGNLTGSYRASLPGGFHLTTMVITYFTSSYFLDGTDDPTVAQGAYTRLDGRLSLESPDGHWALDLIGKNLTDRDILTFAQAFPLSLGSTGVQKLEPRNGAVQIQYRW